MIVAMAVMGDSPLPRSARPPPRPAQITCTAYDKLSGRRILRLHDIIPSSSVARQAIGPFESGAPYQRVAPIGYIDKRSGRNSNTGERADAALASTLYQCVTEIATGMNWQEARPGSLWAL